MKLLTALELGKVCSLHTVQESIKNIEFKAMNIFDYDSINKELEELHGEFKASKLSGDTTIEIAIKKLELATILAIAQRAQKMNILRVTKLTLLMDLENVNKMFGLRLEDLLRADKLNFAHDVCGIQENMDRKNKKLNDRFLPRFTKI